MNLRLKYLGSSYFFLFLVRNNRLYERLQFKIQPNLQPRQHVTTESTKMFILMIWPRSKQITFFTSAKIVSDLKNVKAVA